MKNYTWYKLVGTKPVIDDTNGGWFKVNRAATKLASTLIKENVTVTTIFVCLTSDNAKPLLFESCVLGRGVPEAVRKYATYDEAIQGHKKLVEEMKIICSNM